jgi:ABC-type multidrug transport system fused ATPase/permease subunit
MSAYINPENKIILVYEKNILHQDTNIKKQKKEKNFISVARLVTVLAAIAVNWWLWPRTELFIFAVILFLGVLVFLIFRDADKTADIQNRERLILINRHEIAILSGELNTAGFDNGLRFADPVHPYASDLDLFGPSSLFLYLNRCHAEQSKKLLADSLKSPLPSTRIKEKQDAAKELSEKQTANQQFQSLAMANPLTFKTENRLRYWIAQPGGIFKNRYWIWIKWIYPCISLSILALFVLDHISTRNFLFCFIGFIGFAYLISSKINPDYEMLSRIQPEMDLLHEQLNLVEKENYSSQFLLSLQQRLNPSGNDPASASIRIFHTILKKFEYRMNWPVFIFLNTFLLWDLRQVLDLYAWKNKNQSKLSDWIEVIAEMELTISLASLVYNEPDWCMPETDDLYFHLHGTEIGHPLIPSSTRVTNDFSMDGTGKMAIITGSNMAGKSTFLRSLGINYVLAGMGAPVCARRMDLCEVKMISSMRVADNLAENTSTFYAELKKLEYIIEAVNRNEHVFILLDEVLRGTNSTDRHKGTRALVRQLIKKNAVTVIATHDTDLAHSESSDISVSNYHFEGKILNDELYFDYRIKKGVCESLNATTLMKKIGIHFED